MFLAAGHRQERSAPDEDLVYDKIPAKKYIIPCGVSYILILTILLSGRD
jgi:hypothetical protein